MAIFNIIKAFILVLFKILNSCFVDNFQHYHNDRKFSYRQVWANSVEPDETDQGLHCLPLCLHLLDAYLYGKTTLIKFYGNYNNFRCLNILDFSDINVFQLIG